MLISQTIPIGQNGQPEKWSFDLSKDQCQITIQNEAGEIIHQSSYPRPLFDGLVTVLTSAVEQPEI